MQFIDLKAQYEALKSEIDANIQSVLNAAQFIGGPYIKELEDKLNRAVNRQKVYKQLKAGLFLVASLIFCMFWLGGA